MYVIQGLLEHINSTSFGSKYVTGTARRAHGLALSHFKWLCGLCSAPAGPQSRLPQVRLLQSNIGIRKAWNTVATAILKTDAFRLPPGWGQ